MSLLGRVVAILALLTTLACEERPLGSAVPINTADTSPPVIISLRTQGHEGGELQVTQTSGPITGTLAANESMAIIAVAEDPEGVRTVEVWGTDEKTCTSQSGIATRTGPGLVALPLKESTDTATFPGETRTQRSARHGVVMTDFTCPPGQELWLELVFWAEAVNYAGQRAAISDFMTLRFN